jgi:hypothetical protein
VLSTRFADGGEASEGAGVGRRGFGRREVGQRLRESLERLDA